MQLIDGWVEGAQRVPSPNFNQRPAGEAIDLLVIHNISLPPEQFGGNYIECFFQNKLAAEDHPYFATICDLKVSSHFLIKRDGSLLQFVSCGDRAWHAGASEFCGRRDCNDFSLGIELEGSDHTPYENEQYLQLVALTRVLQKHFPKIIQERIVGHCHIAPDRKTDPGESFDWTRYFSALNGE